MSHCTQGIAGGADIILLPEIPYDIKSIAKVIDGRSKAGKPFTILAVVAEGAISKEDAKLKKKEYKEKLAKRKYPSIAYELAEQIQKETDKEVVSQCRGIRRGAESRVHTTG